ncbi:MAG TPA: hypothetical protein VKU41_07000 [Polyangiaceae bacterium]|nr:hypothetical protein [Polyangiaceae bacterium]
MNRAARAGAALVVAAAATAGPRAAAQPPPLVVDRAVARFYAPETGGTARPRFVGERMLSFEARLVVLSERADGIGDGYQDRHMREALDRHVAEAMLSSLAHRLISGSIPGKRPSEDEIAHAEVDVGAAIVERLGGRARVDAAAAAEQLDTTEVDDLLRRQALAAWYIDRTVSPILQPSDEQLREVFRTANHPFRGRPFEAVRGPLERWLVVERLRAAEEAFLQSARARLTIAVIR